jgi:hypothetical protein
MMPDPGTGDADEGSAATTMNVQELLLADLMMLADENLGNWARKVKDVLAQWDRSPESLEGIIDDLPGIASLYIEPSRLGDLATKFRFAARNFDPELSRSRLSAQRTASTSAPPSPARSGILSSDLGVSWGRTQTAQRLAERLLCKATWLLPARLRATFAEEHAGNLALTTSWREWTAYLVRQLVGIPHTAWVCRRKQRRFSR